MLPTSAGRVLIEHAERIIAATEQAEKDLLQRSDSASGRVRLGLPFSIAALCLSDLLEALQAKCPEITLVFTEGFSGTLVERLAESRLDLAVLVRDPGDPRIALKPVARERMSLIVPRTAPVATQKTMTLEQAVSLPLLLPTRVHGVRRLLDGHAVANGWSLNIQHEVDSAFQLVDLVRRGFGATVLTPSSVSFGRGTDKIISIPIVQPSVWRNLNLAWPADRAPDHVAKMVLAILLDTMLSRLRLHGDAVEWRLDQSEVIEK